MSARSRDIPEITRMVARARRNALDALLDPMATAGTASRLNASALMLTDVATSLIDESDRLLAESKRLQEEASR